MKEAVKLAEYVRDLGFTPEQVQDFLPDTFNSFYLYVLYGNPSSDRREKFYVPKKSS